jgi:hypothetical protein
MIRTYTHHGREVKVDENLMGKHREYCLCHKCASLNVDDREANCPIANKIFEVCVTQGVVLPVWECPEYKETK